MNESIEQFKKRFIPSMLAVLVLAVLVFVFRCNNYVSSQIVLKVATHGKLAEQKVHQLPGQQQFTSGSEGELRLKPKTLTEAMLLSCIKKDGFDLFDIAGILIVAVAIYYMFMDSTNNALFTSKMSTGGTIFILALVWMGPIGNFCRDMLAQHYVPYITNGEFEANYNYKPDSWYMIMMSLLLILTRIPKTGLDLQKEQELTI